MKQIPLIIPVFNQLTYLRNLINWWKWYQPGPVYIVDNRSTYSPLLDFYHSQPDQLHIYPENNFIPNLTDFLEKEIHPKFDRKGSYKTRELFFSQSGEIYIHEKENEESASKITHIHEDEQAPRFIACAYTGFRDQDGKKLYERDIVMCQDVVHEIVFHKGSWKIKSQTVDYTSLIYNPEKYFTRLGNALDPEKVLKT